ncbi:MAG: xanthine dehydrogenase family protein molybdopterin-binding subunit [Alphaproteobacteria bacterium]|nr:xanthine dehydrogenase family protein molybdopterin-binding subunit [Alphaproteobacteria bacterium]
MNGERAPNILIGRPIERVEDPRFLRGRGQYVADVNKEGQLFAVILRSSVAHGMLRKIDGDSALKIPGVRAVITAPDLGSQVPVIPLRLHPLPQLEPFCQPVLAHDKVRYVGEAMAVVVADTAAIAEDALDHIDVEIDSLPAITDRAGAEAAAATLFEQHGTNVAIKWTAVRGDADKAFQSADYVRRETFRVQRHAALFMEPRGIVAEWDDAAQRLTFWGAAKVAFANRKILADAMGLSEQQIDMVEVDVGGGFGSRGEFYPEDFLIPFAARFLNQPIKWVEDRREHLMTGNHAREIECDVEIAATNDGRILGLRGQSWTDNGAYIRTNGSVAPRNVAQYMSGPYAIENIHLTTSSLTTNKTPAGTYRGPGRFEGDFVRERLIDLMARDLGLDSIEVRRKNLVADAQMPYPFATITPYEFASEFDSGDNHALFELCLEEFGWAEKVELQGKFIDGRYHGISIGCFIEGGAAGPSEDARIVLETDGMFSVYLGSASVGQGIETIMAQIAGDALEVPFDSIRVLHGSTAHVTAGYGSFHSRSTAMGGSAILLAAEALRTKIRAVAAATLGCSPSDVSLDADRARGPSDTSVMYAELSSEPIEAEATFRNKKTTYAYGSLAAHVAVDPGTGQVEVIQVSSTKDVGRMINPATLRGQSVGAIVQGLGGTLLEHLVYDEDGQLLTGTLADYMLPTADDFPNISTTVIELKPAPHIPLGAKGAGEGEIIPIGGVIANAVANALADLGVEPYELPLSPPRIWQLIEAARSSG